MGVRTGTGYCEDERFRDKINSDCYGLNISERERNVLERNVGCVIKALNKKGNEYYNLGQLTRATRLALDRENPLGLKDAQEAIVEAEKRGLIRKTTKPILGKVYELMPK